MSTYKVTGIILRKTDYGEADRIYTILTEEGKVSAIAKSVRKINAKLARHLELFTAIELMLARGKNLDVITSARTSDYYRLSEDYDRMRRGFLMLEMTDKLSDTQQTAELFTCLQSGMRALEQGPAEVAELAFKLRLLEVLGQSPRLDADVVNEQPLQPRTVYRFDYERGGLTIKGGDSTRELPPEALKLWRYVFRHGIGPAVRLRGAEPAARESLSVCDGFFNHLYGIEFKSGQL